MLILFIYTFSKAYDLINYEKKILYKDTIIDWYGKRGLSNFTGRGSSLFLGKGAGQIFWGVFRVGHFFYRIQEEKPEFFLKSNSGAGYFYQGEWGATNS